MTIDFQELPRAIARSFSEPGVMAQEVIDTKLAPNVLWTALALVAVLNVLLLALMQMLSPMPDALQQQGIVLSPFTYTILVGSFLVLLVFTVQGFGQMMGGTGKFHDTLTLMIWFQVISLCLEAVQVALVLISPTIGGLFGIVSLGVLLWCIVNFVDVLHGFNNKVKALGTLVLALIGTAMGAGLILAIVGVQVPGGSI